MDIRNIKNGNTIRSDGYSDQPYVVKTDDGHWLMTITVGGLEEGSAGQHVVSLRSCDKGKSWKDITDVSSEKLPESSYSVLYKTKYGRIYCFYNFNADNTRSIIASHPDYKDGLCYRVDTQGHFVFRYSDDNGLSWSDKWYDIPQRTFEVDRLNPYKGDIKYFWNVGKPFEIEDRVLVPLYKIREFGRTFMEHSEGVLLECPNINTEKNPEKLVWNTLPDGDIGIRAPKDVSIISEEHSFVRLSDGTVFCVFRTISGSPYCAYSRDNCHSFSHPEPLRFANGRRVKHPRAANFIWKCENGKYVYWFHNHGGKGYDDRNPVWLCGAVECMTENGMVLNFGQPQPFLYDEDAKVRISYPDLVEDGGEYYLTETQKTVARVHKLDKKQVESLWKSPSETADWKNTDGAALSVGNEKSCSIRFETGEEKGALYSSDTLCITREKNGNIKITVKNGQDELEFINDDEILSDGRNHTVTAVFDGGVCAVYFVTDGVFCDGGEKRQFGFTRFDRNVSLEMGFDNQTENKLLNLRVCEGIHLYD